jgi:hypothetical protein
LFLPSARVSRFWRGPQNLSAVQVGRLCDGRLQSKKIKQEKGEPMPRVREITLDNLKLKISPLTWDEAETYIKEGQAMLARDPKPTNEEWAKRTLESVVLALNKGAAAAANGNGNAGDPWTVEKLKKEFDMISIQQLYDEFMKMSALKAATPGEAQATSTLP